MVKVEKRKTAVILARVSTAGQAEEELPIASQLDAMRERAAKLGADIVREFIEAGVSGRKEKRDTLEEACEYCSLFEVNYFIVWNTARFARHRALAGWLKWKMRKRGTQMIYVSQNIDTTTRGGRLLEGFFELVDEDRAQEVSEDTVRSMMKNAREGFFNGGGVPYGFIAVPDGKRKRLAVLEEEANVVRRIFTEALQGSGTKTIALWLNTAGVRRRGKVWTKAAVGHLLRSWACAGYVVFNRTRHSTREKRPLDEWIKTKSHAAIVEESDFMTVQKLMDERIPYEGGTNALSRFLFTGLARCGACKLAMQIQTGKGRGGKLYSYYKCASSIKGKGCSPRMIPAALLDDLLMDTVMNRVLTRDRMEEMAREIDELSGTWAKDRSAHRAILVQQMRDAELRRKNLFDVLEQHGKGAPNLADLSERLRELNTQIRQLEASLGELEAAPPPAAGANVEAIEVLAEFVKVTLERGTPAKVREFLGSFVDEVVIEDRTAVINYNPARLVGGSGELVRSKLNWLPEHIKLRTALPVQLPERYWLRAA